MTCKVFMGFKIWIIIFLFTISSSFQQGNSIADNSASIKIIFINHVNGNKIYLNDSAYTNSFGEKYTITKLRYYVTNVRFENASENFYEKNSYHLIDESVTASQTLHLSIPAAEYHSLDFLLGVDSLHNVSGAQTGDLDPTKDMFWTWNSGYVMAKMEGNSPSSKLVNNKYEFHVGGFSGTNNVLKEIRLHLPENAIHFEAGKKYDIYIDADINSWWQHPHDIKISEHATITTPGENAKYISDNYANMFHIEKVIPG